jgi:hypothetical protein
MLQPMDVSFNAPFKKLVKGFAVEWLTARVFEAVAAGLDPADVTIRTTKKVLVQPFCSWVSHALARMARDRSTITRAWSEPGLFFCCCVLCVVCCLLFVVLFVLLLFFCLFLFHIV